MGLQGGAERDLRPSRSADGLESRRCQRQHPRCAARAAVGAASHARARARGTLPARRGGRAGEGAATAAAESSTVAAAMRPVRSCGYHLKKWCWGELQVVWALVSSGQPHKCCDKLGWSGGLATCASS